MINAFAFRSFTEAVKEASAPEVAAAAAHPLIELAKRIKPRDAALVGSGAAAFYGVRDVHCPPQYRAGMEQLYRTAAREREDLLELRRKARPKSHHQPLPDAAQ